MIANDPPGIAGVEVLYRYEGTGAGEWHSAPMIDLGGGAFTATINNDDQRYAYSALGGQSGVVRWFLRAVDKLGNAGKSEEMATKIEYCLG